MRFHDVVIPLGYAWSTPFCRWQTALAEIHSLDVAQQLIEAGLARVGCDPTELGGITVGMTVPQVASFYAGPTLASRIGAAHLPAVTIAQACATSAAAIAHAALALEAEPQEGPHLVAVTDRTSNGPLLVTPHGGGTMTVEDRIRDAFAADPLTGMSMIRTADAVAAEAGFTRAQLDEITVLRHAQYQSALDHDRAFQKRYMLPIAVPGKTGAITVDNDQGVRAATPDGATAARTSLPDGVHTGASQTHPADGAAAAILMTSDQASTTGAHAFARIVSSGFSRAGSAQMPKAPVPAARRALRDADLDPDELVAITTHNPFAVNDLWLAQELGVDQQRINPRGSSLVYGHPQAPTGLRALIELIEILCERGGGAGLFTGCAAGDSAGAIVVHVDDAGRVRR